MGIDRVAMMQKEASEAAAAEEAQKKREDEERMRELFTFEAQLHDSTQPFAVTIDSCDALKFYYDKMVQHKRGADADTSKVSKRLREDQEAEIMFSSRKDNQGLPGAYILDPNLTPKGTQGGNQDSQNLEESSKKVPSTLFGDDIVMQPINKVAVRLPGTPYGDRDNGPILQGNAIAFNLNTK